MISNQKELLAAKEKIRMLKEGLSSPVKPDVSELLKNAAISQTKELISEIEAEIFDYERLKSL